MWNVGTEDDWNAVMEGDLQSHYFYELLGKLDCKHVSEAPKIAKPKYYRCADFPEYEIMAAEGYGFAKDEDGDIILWKIDCGNFAQVVQDFGGGELSEEI